MRGGARPRSYRGTRPRFASGTLMSLRTAPAPRRAPDLPTGKILKGDSPTRPIRKTPSHKATGQTATASPAPHAKHQPPHNTLNRDSPPRPSSLGTGRTRNHRAPTATTARPQRTPNTDTRGGAYILCRDIRVSELCEDGSPAGAKRIICTSHDKTVFQGERKNPADSEESAGFSFKCAPWDSNPEPID